MKMRIKKGDKVKMLSGKDRGKSGKVLEVFPRSGKVIVENLNMVKKHLRPTKEGEKGKRVEVAMPVSVSKVMIICSHCGKATRIGYKLEGKKKFRICKKCGKEI